MYLDNDTVAGGDGRRHRAHDGVEERVRRRFNNHDPHRLSSIRRILPVR